MTEQQSALRSASAREDNMTSRTASHELAEQPGASALVNNDEKASQPDDIGLEAGTPPEMLERRGVTNQRLRRMFTPSSQELK